MKKLARNLRRSISGVIVLLMVGFIFFPAGCKQKFPANIYITNVSGETLDIFMDGILLFTMENSSSQVIRDVESGDHLFEAKISGTDEIYFSYLQDVQTNTDYTWEIIPIE